MLALIGPVRPRLKFLLVQILRQTPEPCGQCVLVVCARVWLGVRRKGTESNSERNIPAQTSSESQGGRAFNAYWNSFSLLKTASMPNISPCVRHHPSTRNPHQNSSSSSSIFAARRSCSEARHIQVCVVCGTHARSVWRERKLAYGVHIIYIYIWICVLIGIQDRMADRVRQ
jgi:hypothetical protein